MLTPADLAFARATQDLSLVPLEKLLECAAHPSAGTLQERLEGRGLLTPADSQAAAEAAENRGQQDGMRGERYTLGEILGRGANGVVLNARDRRLGRPIALKVHARGADLDAIELGRFAHEAQVTGQLAHPSVVPVHDLGFLSDGRPYYTMKRIDGRSLKQVLDAYKKDEPGIVEEWTVPHMISVLLRVAQALAFAHDRGVVHRDVKPANVMVGEYGEVLLLDWGVARVLGTAASGRDAVHTWRSLGQDDQTIAGTIAGTPAYMAPEQAQGRIDVIGPHTDVWSLGIVLFEFLCGQRPFKARSVRGLLEVIVKEVAPRPSLISRRFPISAELEQVVLRCLARDPADRYADAGQLAAALQELLEGSRQREEAEQLTRRAGAKAAAYVHAAEAAARREDELQDLETSQAPWADRPDRQAVWALEGRWRSLRKLRDDTYDEAVSLYLAALERAPGNEPARTGLASLYLRRMDEAEQRGERGAARFFRGQVLRYDTGALRPVLDGQSRLHIATDPPGAECRLRPIVEQDRVLVAGEARPLGATPVDSIPVGSGGWVVELQAPGRVRARLPIWAERPRTLRFDLTLPREGAVADDFVWIPSGPFLSGGDPAALGATRRREVRIGSFALARHPVTVSQFREFLDSGGAAQGHSCWTGPDAVPDALRGLLPALGVSYPGAQAYARWLSNSTGSRFRLPTHDEWEKAARGADGRIYPWGNAWEPTFCNGPDSQPREALPEPIGSRVEDQSVYGVCDLAGGVSEWVTGAVPHRPDRAWLRGGSWNGLPQQARICSRLSMARDTRGGTVGFRLAQDVG